MRAWLALALQGRRDAALDPTALRRRDRALTTSGRPAQRVRTWIDAVLDDEDRELLRRVDASLRGLSVALVVLGLVAGTGVAAAVFRYDGTRPIDLLPALAVFAVLPMLLLLGFVVSALPSGALTAIPGVRDLQESLLALASALASALLRALPAEARATLTRTFGEGRAHQRLFGRVQKWMLLGELQRFAVAFHVGAIAWFVLRVFVTDLGFTWSATAEAVTPERLHALIEGMALPWSSFWPSAVPSLEDVRATQFFRLGEGTVGAATTRATDPALLSHWWTFVLATMVTYGLLPRVVAAVFANMQYRAAVQWTLTHAPIAMDALDRMDAPAVETRAPEAEVEGETAAPSAVDDAGTPGGTAHGVVWADAARDTARLRAALQDSLGLAIDPELTHAGANTPLDAEARLVEDLATSLPADGAAIVIVKAWEPATMDAVDFVRSLRSALGDGRRIVVAARRLNGEDADVAQWRDRMTAIGDPWLRTIGFDLEGTA